MHTQSTKRLKGHVRMPKREVAKWRATILWCLQGGNWPSFASLPSLPTRYHPNTLMDVNYRAILKTAMSQTP